jgi:hypothetical protein
MNTHTELYEKLGLFYLGKEVNSETGELTDELLLYKNKNLTTHAALIGMTGSGKTGLGIGIIEEAVMDNVPVIIIDPKGDMGNLLLTFPDLKPEDFEPWIDPVEAESKGISVKDFAAKTAETWKSGIESWHQNQSRIKTLKENAEYVIYTPGSSAGVQLSVLSNFDAPSEEILDDTDTFTSLINSTVTSLLALIKISGDPLQSKEYLLLSSIFMHLWKKERNLSLEELIGFVTNPPFDKIGVLPLNSFYNQTQRLDLAMKLNAILAGPGFSAWTEGDALDIKNLLYTTEGKPKVSILSISHLDESQRMFFVTLFLNKYISWMRHQSGTSSLRTLLYMDEIFGYFPAVSNPPSKKPMLLLLKQARAFGVGVVLATQNPIDLDYKGLSNIGSWFIGRLQTKQDKDRVMDGLIQNSENALQKNEIEKLLSNIQSRIFLYKSAHEDGLKLMQSRWVLSYLRGPLSKPEIKKLTEHLKTKYTKTEIINEEKNTSVSSINSEADVVKAFLSDDIPQFYTDNINQNNQIIYKPFLLTKGNVKFINSTKGINVEQVVSGRQFLDEKMTDIDLSKSLKYEFDSQLFHKNPAEQSRFLPLPVFFQDLKSVKPIEKQFIEFIYQTKKLEIYKCSSLKAESKAGESLNEFKIRIIDLIREEKAEAVEKLRLKYSSKGNQLQDKYNKLEIKLHKEQSDVSVRQTDTAVNFGMAVLGSFLGSGTKRKITGGINSAAKVSKEKADVQLVEKEIILIQNEMQELKSNLRNDIDKIDKLYVLDNYTIESFFITPKKTDIYNIETVLLWDAE